MGPDDPERLMVFLAGQYPDAPHNPLSDYVPRQSIGAVLGWDGERVNRAIAQCDDDLDMPDDEGPVRLKPKGRARIAHLL